MASPVDAARAQTIVSTAADPWTAVNLPTGIVSGDLLFMVIRVAATLTVNTPSGWTKDTNIGDFGSDASDDIMCQYWRQANGTEGATMTVDLTGSAKGAAIVWRVTGAELIATQPPESGTPGTGTAANIDPPGVTPTGGSKDYLFIVVAGLDGETQTFTAPSGYTNLQESNSGTGGSAATNCRMAGASKTATASSENPGIWTHAAPSAGVSAWVTAFHPAAAGANTYTKAGFGKESG